MLDGGGPRLGFQRASIKIDIRREDSLVEAQFGRTLDGETHLARGLVTLGRHQSMEREH
jgi:hypothetical protein